MKEKKVAREQAREIGRKQRFLLVGAALGLYYGIFYRPSDVAPDYGIAIVLSIFAALITVAIRFWGKKQPFASIVKSFVWTFLFYAAFLLVLAFRKLAEQLGGRAAVTVLTTLTGIGLAYLLASRKGPFESL
jgi:hypothetical protein